MVKKRSQGSAWLGFLCGHSVLVIESKLLALTWVGVRNRIPARNEDALNSDRSFAQ